MRRREFLRTAGLIGAGASLPGAIPSRPNIIFVLADELGIGGLSCYGGDTFLTPNLDALARGGMRFTHAYTAPLGGPSRALILTGRYAFRTGATNQTSAATLDPAKETALPRLLQHAGYVSAAIGRWTLTAAPSDFGFDESQTGGPPYHSPNGYTPDRMHDYLAGFLTRHRARPFYVYYSLSQVHTGLRPTPDTPPSGNDFYGDNIRYMDRLIGKLVDVLERLKLRENTLVVFTSDSGTGSVYADEATVRGRRLAGAKGSLLEGGSLVPLLANWPGVTPSGIVSDDLIDSTDFLPTFAELAGAQLPETPLDGHSFAPRLLAEAGKPRAWVYVQLGAQWYVRDANRKLNQAGELFDMTRAPYEEPRLTGSSPALRAVLDQLNPAAGIQDSGDGSGRSVNHSLHTRKKKLY